MSTMNTAIKTWDILITEHPLNRGEYVFFTSTNFVHLLSLIPEDHRAKVIGSISSKLTTAIQKSVAKYVKEQRLSNRIPGKT